MNSKKILILGVTASGKGRVAFELGRALASMIDGFFRLAGLQGTAPQTGAVGSDDQAPVNMGSADDPIATLISILARGPRIQPETSAGQVRIDLVPAINAIAEGSIDESNVLPALRDLVNMGFSSVSVTVDGDHQGTYQYSTFVPAVDRRSVMIFGDGETAEFDHVSVRVAE